MINFLKSDELVVGNIYKEILPGSGEYIYYIFVKHNDQTYGYSKSLAFHSARNIHDLLKLKGTPPATFFSYSFFDKNVKLTPIGDLEPVTVLEDDTLPRTVRLSKLDDGIVYSVHHKGTRWVSEYVLLNDYTLYWYSLFTKRWLKVPYKEVLGIIWETNEDVDVTEAFTYPSLPWEIKGDK
ncbi:hypothetical protein HOS95_gp10 [Salmonella phage vB_SpuP_Spp16]|uniref:Uncharacterized protein n=1 Tax=Salmonella phage vB_SpuP_Spp16 TaxID=2081603 RepID=A0A2P9JZT3_9CAUD|nr:hypothetical protein HOS95_gp10 [Salmonella phage vB_SpuP_Spp16]AVI05049.1 hypothetical protein [Salmonella phage vB_SpuP_Spp16]